MTTEYHKLLQKAQLRDELRLHPVLKYLFFELTDSCNMSCMHCGSNCNSLNKTFLPFSQIKKVLDEVKGAYGSEEIIIVLTGGEPLLHKDFFDIVHYIDKLGFRWGMTTNATLIDEQVAQKLIQNHLGSVSISLDGLKHQHESLRLYKGGFDLAVKGIQNLLKYKQYPTCVQITTVISQLNYDSLEEIYQFAKSLGVDSFRPINIEPIGRTLKHPDLLLSGQQYYGLLQFVAQKRKEDQQMEVTFGCSHYLGPTFENKVRKHSFICGSGLYIASVLCNGDIYSCLDIERREELVQGNVSQDSFVDVWEHRFVWFRSDRSLNNEKCRKCSERYICNGDGTHCWNMDENRPNLCLYEILKEEERKMSRKSIRDEMPTVIYGPPEMLDKMANVHNPHGKRFGFSDDQDDKEVSACRYCGKNLMKDFKYCPYCGRAIDKRL